MMTKPTIHLVEDDEDIREYLESILEEEFEVMSFSDAKSALDEACKSNPPDLIVADFRMPEMDGIMYLKALKDNGIDKPFVFVTGAADKKMAVSAISLGVSAILEKPVKGEDVLITVKKSLAIRQTREFSEELIIHFQTLTESMRDLIKVYQNRFYEAENKLFEHKVKSKSQEDILKYLNETRVTRKCEDSVDKSEDRVKEIANELKNLRKLTG